MEAEALQMLLQQGGSLPWLGVIGYTVLRTGRWLAPRLERLLEAHIHSQESIISTQVEITALLKSVDARLAAMETN